MFVKLQAEHYKSLSHVEVALEPVTVLVGPNATGKSNVIDVLKFLRQALAYDLDRAVSERHGIASLRQWSPYRPYNVTVGIVVRSSEGSGQYSFTLGSSGGHFNVIREEGEWRGDALVGPGDFSEDDLAKLVDDYDVRHSGYFDVSRTTRFVREPGRSDGLRIEQDYGQFNFISGDESISIGRDELYLTHQRGYVLGVGEDLQYLRNAIVDFEAYSIFPNTLRTPQTPTNDTRLDANGSNLTSVYRALNKTQAGRRSKSRILEAMRIVMPELETINVQSVGGLMVPMFRVRGRGPDGRVHDFNVSQVSDGTLRMFGILTALFQPDKPSVVALEEPEQTVNPGILGLLSDAIRSVKSQSSQLVVSTHSPDLIDEFSSEEIRAVQYSDESTIVGSIEDAQRAVLRDRLFTAGELMRIEGLRPSDGS